MRSNQQVVRASERGGRAPARGPEGGEAGRASCKVSCEALDLGGTRETPGSWKGGTGTVHRPEALLQRSSGWALPFLRQALPWVGLHPLSARLWSPPPHSLLTCLVPPSFYSAARTIFLKHKSSYVTLCFKNSVVPHCPPTSNLNLELGIQHFS